MGTPSYTLSLKQPFLVEMPADPLLRAPILDGKSFSISLLWWSQSCKKYRNLGSKLTENLKTSQKVSAKFSENRKMSISPIPSTTVQVFLFLLWIQSSLMLFWMYQMKNFWTSADLSKNYYSFFNITRNIYGLKAFSYLINVLFQ